MDFRFLYHRLRYVIFNPSLAWTSIYTENRPISYVRNSFFFPLIALVSISAFLGSVIFTNTTLSTAYSVLAGLKFLILHLIVVYCSALILCEITKALDLGKDFVVSFKLIAYSVSPLLICQIFSLVFESLVFINILSLYGLYVFWIGSAKMLNPPEHKKMPMLVAIAVVVAGFYIAGGIILSGVIDRIYFGFLA